VRSGASSSTTSFAETRNIARYFVVGGVCALVDLSIFLAFAQGLGMPYLRVSAASFVVATLLNYFLSVRFVFVSGLRFGRRWEMALVELVDRPEPKAEGEGENKKGAKRQKKEEAAAA